MVLRLIEHAELHQVDMNGHTEDSQPVTGRLCGIAWWKVQKGEKQVNNLLTGDRTTDRLALSSTIAFTRNCIYTSGCVWELSGYFHIVLLNWIWLHCTTVLRALQIIGRITYLLAWLHKEIFFIEESHKENFKLVATCMKKKAIWIDRIKYLLATFLGQTFRNKKTVILSF